MKRDILWSSNERDAAYIESFWATEWEETAFKTEDNNLILVGNDGTDAGKR